MKLPLPVLDFVAIQVNTDILRDDLQAFLEVAELRVSVNGRLVASVLLKLLPRDPPESLRFVQRFDRLMVRPWDEVDVAVGSSCPVTLIGPLRLDTEISVLAEVPVEMDSRDRRIFCRPIWLGRRGDC